jgi:hypothetical protein
MIISIDAEKSFSKIPNHFMKNALRNNEFEEYTSKL